MAELIKKRLNIISLMLERIIKLFLGFGVSIFLARHLGDEGYGKLNYIISFVGIFAPFYVFGSEETTMKGLVSKKESTSKVLSSSILIKLFGGTLGVGLCLLLAFLVAPQWSLGLICLYALSFYFQVFVTFHHYFLTKSQGQYDSAWKIVAIILLALIKLLFIYLNFEWKAFVVISSAELIIFGGIHLLTFFTYKKETFEFVVDKKSVRALLYASAPVFLFLLFDQALLRVDQVMIGNFLGDASLGQYAVASKLVNLWNFVPILVLSTLLPRMVSDLEDKEKSFKLNQKIVGGFLFASLIFALSVGLIASPLVNLLYGKGFEQSADILRVYAWFPAFYGFVLFRSKLFIVREHLALAISLSAGTVLVNLLLNFYFIPEFGVMGAIYSTFVSITAVTVIFTLFNKTVRETSLMFSRSIYRAPLDFVGLIKELR